MAMFDPGIPGGGLGGFGGFGEGSIPGIGPTTPITFVNLAAKFFGREGRHDIVLARFVGDTGLSVLNDQLKILKDAGAENTGLYQNLFWTKEQINDFRSSGNIQGLVNIEEPLTRLLARTQDIITPPAPRETKIGELPTSNIFNRGRRPERTGPITTGGGFTDSLETFQFGIRNLPRQSRTSSGFIKDTSQPLNRLQDALDRLLRGFQPPPSLSGPSRTGIGGPVVKGRGRLVASDFIPPVNIDYEGIRQRIGDDKADADPGVTEEPSDEPTTGLTSPQGVPVAGEGVPRGTDGLRIKLPRLQLPQLGLQSNISGRFGGGVPSILQQPTGGEGLFSGRQAVASRIEVQKKDRNRELVRFPTQGRGLL